MNDMNTTEALLARDRFAALSGIVLLKAENGTAEASMEIGPQHLNGIGIVNGGAVYTLADFVMAAAANSREEASAVSLTTTITFMAARKCGVLMARAREVSLKRSVATYQVDVTDDAGEMVASLTGMVYRKFKL